VYTIETVRFVYRCVSVYMIETVSWVCVRACSLACAVSYLSASGDKMYFRKFFKFHVSLSKCR